MTRKDFEAIAKAIRDVRTENRSQMSYPGTVVSNSTTKDISEAIADYLATTNPRFDRERFLKACGITTD